MLGPSQLSAAVVYWVETYFSSFGALVADFGIVRQPVLYLVTILVSPFVVSHHGCIVI